LKWVQKESRILIWLYDNLPIDGYLPTMEIKLNLSVFEGGA